MNAISNQLQLLRETALWVEQAQAGDREAFGRLFEKYRRGILAIIHRRLQDEHAAQELCQDVFVQAMQKLGQLRTPECFGSWLRSIAVRMAINLQQRRRVLRAMDPDLAASAVVDAQEPVDQALRSEQASQVRCGLRRLRRMDRDTLIAFYVDGQSLVEMAGKFAAPVGTIKRRLHVARKRLAKEIESLAVGF
jgi:RNA polymerase sigma-70 factor (ECF subfamily)